MAAQHPLRGRRHALTGRLAITLCVIAALATAGPAYASHGGELPWAGGQAVETAFERKAAEIAAEIAGRPGQVFCQGETDWNSLAKAQNFDPNIRFGFVPGFGTPGARFFSPIGYTHLAPGVCTNLDEFAAANPKPTTCPVSKTETEIVKRTERRR